MTFDDWFEETYSRFAVENGEVEIDPYSVAKAAWNAAINSKQADEQD